ncbi:MAG: tetratricopeptide repeat protein, partial [Gammaproteobacteria bacterium]|nr:tetratricopeptide repeat protein [Gammaproteobacteria bacterium]
MVTSTQLELIGFVNREAPELSNKMIPIKYELFKTGNLKLDADSISKVAQLTYSRNEFDETIKIVGNFANEYPDHQDIGTNYLYVGKSLFALNKPEQAYRLLTALINKYPGNSQISEIKTFLIDIKNTMKKK